MRVMKAIIISILLLSTVCSAEVYRSVDKEGNVVFSDTPSEHAEPITIDVAPSYSPPTFEPLQTDVQTEKEPAIPVPAYQISITSPVQNQTFQNPESITVKVNIKPNLSAQRGDKLVFKLDGVSVTEPQTQPSAALQNIDRGSHIVLAQIVDKNGKVLKSSKSVLFHVQRHSILIHRN